MTFQFQSLFNASVCRYFVVLPTKAVHPATLMLGPTGCFCGCRVPGHGGPKHLGSQKLQQILRRSLDSLLCPRSECTRVAHEGGCGLEPARSVPTWPFLSAEPIQNHLKPPFYQALKRGERSHAGRNGPSVPASRPLICLPEGLLCGSRCGVKAQCAAVRWPGGSACEASSCQEY